MNKVMALQSNVESNQLPSAHFNAHQLEILKNTICRGISYEEFQIFLMACIKTQLDPFMRQIYAVKRKYKKPDGSWGESMTIQTGIDGYRLIAERTGCYAPGPECTYTLDANGNLVSATSYIKKQTKDGTWHTVSSSAYLDEYMQSFVDRKTGEKKPSGMWATMPKTMLAKCAESQALRKAFPAEMSGVYTKEEMEQAEPTKITLEQAAELDMILAKCDVKYRDWVNKYIISEYGSENLSDLPADLYQRMKQAAVKNMEAYYNKQCAESEKSLLSIEELS